MNIIWLVCAIATIGFLIFKDPNLVLVSLSEAGSKAVVLSLELCGIYAVWGGIMNIVEKTGFSKVINRFLSPIIDFLFGKNLNEETKNLISMNISTNLLGMGGAATPLGIKAIEQLNSDKNNKTATPQMVMLVVLASTSLQLLPMTLIGLMSANGSVNPSSIIIPCLVATAVSTFVGILCVKLISKFAWKKPKLKEKPTLLIKSEKFK